MVFMIQEPVLYRPRQYRCSCFHGVSTETMGAPWESPGVFGGHEQTSAQISW